MRIFKIIGAYLLCLFSLSLNAQNYIPEVSVDVTFQGGVGKYAPFWLTANKYGLYSFKNNQLIARTTAIKTVKSENDYFYGLDLVNRFDGENTPMLHQLYGGYKFKAVTAYGGIKEDVFGNHYSDLSAGGALWSKNAQPMPLVYAGIPEYTVVPFTFNYIEVMGGMAHGWFGDKDQFVKKAYLHYKYAMLRLKLIGTLKFSLGLHHAVQWGGHSLIYGDLGSGLREFKWAFTSSSSDGSVGPEGEQINAYGNSVASYNAGLDYQISNYDLKLYYQNFCEDSNGRVITFSWNYFHVGGDWRNKPDGLFGFALVNKNQESVLKSFLFEYIHTSHQSGDPFKSGNDNYYNNYVYQTGWTYKKMTLGTPLITSPAYASNLSNTVGQNIANNCVIAFHAGVKLDVAKNLITAMVTYSLNKGTISIPYSSQRKQFSSYLECLHACEKYKNLYLGCDAGLDVGEMYGDNFGVRVKMKKAF